MEPIVSYYRIIFNDQTSIDIEATAHSENESEHIFAQEHGAPRRFPKATVEKVICTGFRPFIV